MTHVLGIDVGTSAVKALIVDEAQAVVAEADAPLGISRPHPDWSEQDPDDWWSAVAGVLDGFRRDAPGPLSDVAAIGLSGQMHGAVLLGEDHRPLRPAMLWNDGRAGREAAALNASHPELPAVVGVLAMPGFTAPKIPWLAAHEPAVLERLRTVLLPKDFVRLKLTGETLTDVSDAAGTWWLDQQQRRWSEAALAATGLRLSQMPGILEGSQAGGTIRPEWAARWGLRRDVIVAGGGGDAAAGAVGIGAVHDGDAFVSLGTSGQLFVSTDEYRPAPRTMVHAFGHALPDRWFQMGAMLNGASCLAFAARLLGEDIAPLLAQAEDCYAGPARLLFLPYLTGERTPHNDPAARGVFFGLTPETSRAELVQAVLEGVAFSVADAQRALAASGTVIASAGLIGGGARSLFWTRILASVLGLPLTRYKGGEKGPAFGAARLARLALTGEPAETVCARPPVLDTTLPDPATQDAYAGQFEKFRSLYKALATEFRRV